ncbi:MAG: tRNA 2-thiouridine(34) synthase MnmA [Phycisphaerae bacterium]|nr:tRNA 2-thiouridine(34) synthase MnmA [Phycisphaerae bacterium]
MPGQAFIPWNVSRAETVTSAGRKKVLVAMSGGVDSSVAAALLVEQGYEVIGLYMRVGVEAPVKDDSCSTGEGERIRQGCCGTADADDARLIAGRLSIPFYALDFKDDFERIIDYFTAEYSRGRTPNPCVMCNERIKFGKLPDYANAIGADYVATGHYARVGQRGGQPVLMKAVDDGKDQSYVLFGIDRAVLPRVRFPLGEMTKEQVRQAALDRGLPVHDKPGSVEICFVPDQDYARLVRRRRPESFVPGDVVDTEGNLLGRHNGLPRYTIGQRRGLGIATGRPVYVIRLDVETNTVVLGERQALLQKSLIAEKVKLLVDAPHKPFRVQAKIRYLHKAAPATATFLDHARVQVEFDEPQPAITPGQACVLYDGDVVVGGGWIQVGRAIVRI